MKKTLVISIILALLLTITACSSDKNKEVDDDESLEKSSSEEASKEEENNEKESETDNVIKKSEDEEEKNEDIKEDLPMENFVNASFVKGIDDYVATLDIKEIDVFSNLDLKFNAYPNPEKYTGNTKKSYTDGDMISIRIPFLKGSSELAKNVNEEILDVVKNETPEEYFYLHIDYDAYIFEDILSMKVNTSYMSEGMGAIQKKILKTYNFDISSGELVPLSCQDIFERYNIDESILTSFMPEYMRAELDEFYTIYDEEVDIDQELLNATSLFEENYKNNNVLIYKNGMNDHFTIEFAYEFYSVYGEILRSQITLAPSEIEMALLSRPGNSTGVIYKAYGLDSQKVPEKDMYNQKTNLQELNPGGEGSPVYFMSFVEGDKYTELCKLEYLNVELEEDFILVKKILPHDITLKQTDYSDIYLYNTTLAETIPWEAVCIGGEKYYGSAQEEIYDDLKYGDRIQYIFPEIPNGRYYTMDNSGIYEINLEPNREFTANGPWSNQGINISSGTYSSDDKYLYLFPCKEDLQNGAEEYYVFEIDKGYLELSLYYSAKSGLFDMTIRLTKDAEF